MSVSFEARDGVAVIGLGGSGKFPWGTAMEEHRINPMAVQGLNDALDRALADDSVQSVLVHNEGKFFCNGMDLLWIDSHSPAEADQLQADAEALMARIVAFPLPTVAAIKGHFTAAGGMLGLSFDVRVMSSDRGYFFVPAIDLGLVYSPGMTSLMMNKTPFSMHRDMIQFAKRFSAADLLSAHVVEKAVPGVEVFDTAWSLAVGLKAKGKNARYRDTMHKIKLNMYADTVRLLTDKDAFQGMGFENKEKGVETAGQPAKL